MDPNLSVSQYQPGAVKQLDIVAPQDAELKALIPGVYWLRMPLPMSLNHINLYLLEENDGWCLVDTGMHLPDTIALWQNIFSNRGLMMWE